MAHSKNSSYFRKIRHLRLRKKLSGSPDRPRLSVFRSLNHIYAQIIDDAHGSTVVSASSAEPEVRSIKDGQNKSQVAASVGAMLAQRAKEKGIQKVVFDKGGFKYHGRVKSLAEAAREGGLEF